ncbi:unnamed protein product [Ilex paraguariensis]|uniref:Disease resistance protein At4g27190-like leucine-rich repeats domain-containing protein n=1 Tax=Ilex paraguariensis TaxID=185542 RepID=A0ABC8U8B5_9AQUA
MNMATSALGPIWTAFTYLKDYDKNVKAFEQEVQNLNEDIVSLEQRVDEDQQNGKVILPNVTWWLQRLAQIYASHTPHKSTFSNWLSERIKESEVLNLKSDGSKSVVDELNLNGFLHLKELRIQKCGKMEYLTNAVHGRPPANIVIFPILSTLDLSDLANLIGVCGDQLPATGSFRELKELRLSRLHSLTQLWKCPTQNVCLGNLRLVLLHECGSLGSLLSLSIASGMAQLEELHISNCGKLVEVFSDESADGNVTSKIKFPKLKTIELENLQSLIHFCGRIDGIEFPRLNGLKVCGMVMVESGGFGLKHQDFLVLHQRLPSSLLYCQLHLQPTLAVTLFTDKLWTAEDGGQLKL